MGLKKKKVGEEGGRNRTEKWLLFSLDARVAVEMYFSIIKVPGEVAILNMHYV